MDLSGLYPCLTLERLGSEKRYTYMIYLKCPASVH